MVGERAAAMHVPARISPADAHLGEELGGERPAVLLGQDRVQHDEQHVAERAEQPPVPREAGEREDAGRAEREELGFDAVVDPEQRAERGEELGVAATDTLTASPSRLGSDL